MPSSSDVINSSFDIDITIEELKHYLPSHNPLKVSVLPKENKIVLNFKKVKLVDHSFMNFIHHYEFEMKEKVREINIIGF